MGEKRALETETKKLFQWLSLDPSKQRIFDGLTVSALGAGTYLGPPDDATDRLYEEALLQAALKGVNFFDTAINYRCMRSEKVLGKVFKQLFAKEISREQIVISTKGGFLPCEGSLEQFEDYIRIHYLDTGLIEAKEIVAECHCMSPAFLENQIATSLKNLGLECIDLYYLHNPEIQLAELGEEEFYTRLSAAFALFEQKVQEKKIQRYGLATWNGFRQKKNSLQLSRVLECAKQVGGEAHHFRAIQLPLNLVMLEALHIENQLIEKESKPILEVAGEHQIAVMVSAPLMQSQVAHLSPRVFEKLPPEKSPILQALQFVLSAPITTAFVGMKQLAHWEENREVLFLPNWSQETWEEACISLGIKSE